MMEPHVRTFRDRIRDAVRAFKGSKVGSLTFGVDVKRCDKCEYKAESTANERVLYLCDREKCEVCGYPECQYTSDVRYAKNFHTEMDVYVEDAPVKEEI